MGPWEINTFGIRVRLFTYFSTHCWAWKHTVSVGQSSPMSNVYVVFLRSFSAFSTHLSSHAQEIIGLGHTILFLLAKLVG